MRLAGRIVSVLVTGILLVGCQRAERIRVQKEMAPAPGPSAYDRSSSHGGDNCLSEQGTAWFENPKEKIRACLEVSPSYPFSDVELKEKLKSTYETWMHYIDDKFVHDRKLTRNGEPPPPMIFPREINWVDCDGNENIRFLFDMPHPRLAPELPRYENPVAISKLLDYDWVKRMGSGLVWFAGSKTYFTNAWAYSTPRLGYFIPLDRYAGVIEAHMLHEWGHILGVEHVPGTIMAADYVERLVIESCLGGFPSVQHPTSLLAPYLYRIDNQRALVLSERDEVEKIDGALGWDRRFAQANSQFLLHEDYREGARVVLELQGAATRLKAPSRILILNGKQRTEIQLRLHWVSRPDTPLARIFKRCRTPDECYAEEHQIEVYSGELLLPDGRKIPASLERNTTYESPLTISYFKNGKEDGRETLFYQNSGWTSPP